MAYFVGVMVSGLPVYTAGRQSKQHHPKSVDCMVSHRIVAWCKLELHTLGTLFWFPDLDRTSIPFEGTRTNSKVYLARIPAVHCFTRLGDLLLYRYQQT